MKNEVPNDTYSRLTMHTPDPEIREALWERDNVGILLLASRLALPKRDRVEFVEILKKAYQMGLDRGFDMGTELAKKE